MSLTQGVIPNHWKSAVIFPIFDNSSKYSHKNYHPISLSSMHCHVFEYVAAEPFLHHFISHD